jgi:two-component system, OmpR family, response regulator
MGSRGLDADPTPVTRAAPHTLLVVEDDAGIRTALLEALTAEGFVVELAANGAEAISFMIKSRPDLVLLDLMMPHMTGWQLLDEIRRLPRLADIPVFVVTAAQYAGRAPAGYPIFVKPLSLQYLVRSIRSLLD